MTIDKLINLVFTITLVEMMISIGLGVRIADIIGVIKDPWLMVRAGFANYVCVPAIVLGLLLLLHPLPMVAAGFLIAAVCPGAPYGPPFTGIAKGNVPLAVGLMVILAGSSAVLAPLLLGFLLPLVSGSHPLRVDVEKIVVTLIGAQLVPLCAGLGLRHRYPRLAAKLCKPASRVSVGLNLIGIGGLIVLQSRMLLQIRPVGFAGMLALVIAALAAGWLLGGAGVQTRKTLAIATSVRNVGVSLVIATGSFPGTPAVTATMAFALFQTVVLASLAVAWGRLSPTPLGVTKAKAA
jgi:bile acid:Na+ symporter, BASS family